MIHSYAQRAASSSSGGAVRHDDLKIVVNLVRRMQEEAGYYPDVYCLTSLLSVHSKSGLHDMADNIARSAFERGIVPTRPFLNAILQNHGRAGRADEAAELCGRMREKYGVSPGLRSYSAVINAYARIGDSDSAVKWLDILEQQSPTLQLDATDRLYAYNSAIDSFSQSGGGGAAAVAMFDRLVDSGLKPDALSMNPVLAAYAKEGLIHQAWTFMRKATEEHNITPTVASYNCLLSACAYGPDPALANIYLETMKSEGYPPNVISFCTIIHAYAVRQDVAHASDWFNKMIEHNVEPNAKCYNC